jgi:hypothetical protein
VKEEGGGHSWWEDTCPSWRSKTWGAGALLVRAVMELYTDYNNAPHRIIVCLE